MTEEQGMSAAIKAQKEAQEKERAYHTLDRALQLAIQNSNGGEDIETVVSEAKRIFVFLTTGE